MKKQRTKYIPDKTDFQEDKEWGYLHRLCYFQLINNLILYHNL